MYLTPYINRPDYFGYTPLMDYIARGNATLKGVQEMVYDQGANVEHTAYNGETPLTLAYRSAPFAVVEFLIIKGADTKYAAEHLMKYEDVAPRTRGVGDIPPLPELKEVEPEEEEQEKPNILRRIVDRFGYGTIVAWLAIFSPVVFYIMEFGL